MKTLDNLLYEREKLLELIKYAKLFEDNIRIGSKLISLEKLQEMFNDIQIEIENNRSRLTLRRVK